jgi:hypothetical protein
MPTLEERVSELETKVKALEDHASKMQEDSRRLDVAKVCLERIQKKINSIQSAAQHFGITI